MPAWRRWTGTGRPRTRWNWPVAAAPGDDALSVSLETMTPSTLPRRGSVTLTGEVTNDSDETWTDLQVYMVTAAQPIQTRDGLAEAAATDPAVIAAVTELGVEPVRGTSDPNPTFAVAYVYRLQELTTARRIADVKSRLQRTNPVDNALEYNRMFGELVMLEQHRRKLREGAVGQTGAQS